MRVSAHRFAVLLTFVSLLSLSGPWHPTAARATVGPPVLVTLDSPSGPAVRGQAFIGTLRIISSVPGLVYDFEVAGSSWGSLDWGGAQEFPVQANVPIELEFSGTPLEGPFPLLANFRFGMMEGHITLDVTAEAWAVGQGPAPAVKIPAGVVPPPPAGAGSLLLPRLPAEYIAATIDPTDLVVEGGGTALKAPRLIRVRGRIAYRNQNDVYQGGDGVFVRCFHQQWAFDPQLGATVTDPWGNFEITFNWTNDVNPNLYLVFGLYSEKVEVKSASWQDFLTAGPYSWRTGTVNNYAGSDLDFGNLGPSDTLAARQSVHLFSDLTRAWRWCASRGYDLPKVTGRFPSEWWPCYTANVPFCGDMIFMRGGEDGVGFGWRDDTHIHEYGHHFVQHMATAIGPDYSNNICDTPNAGHCIWCQETDHDAFAEGFPNWLADIVTRSFAGDYGTPALRLRPQETPGDCRDSNGMPCPCDPLLTEGFMGTVLRDIEDADQDAHGLFPGGMDELAQGESGILTVVAVDRPTTPLGFLQAYRGRYPAVREQLWATAKNSGYELDTLPPGVVGDLASSHEPGGLPGTTPRISLTWTRATDEASGIAGYSIMVLPYAAAIGPDNTIELGDVTAWTTDILTAGNWWFSIRAIDRSGKASDNFVQIGPMGISNPVPNDLRHEVPFGWNWSAPIAVRGTPDGNAGSTFTSPTLPGDAESYVNNLIYNFGASTVNFSYSLLSIDGEHPFFGASWLVPSLPGYTVSARNNVPFSATGGRHTVAILLDSGDYIAETNEANNLFAQQFVWIPAPVPVGSPTWRNSPPLRWANSEAVPGGLIYANCDALRFTGNPPSDGHWWTAAWMHATNNAVDFDLNLYVPATGSSAGFQNPVASSAWSSSYLDFTILNNRQQAGWTWDAGVLNYSGVYSPYELGVVGSTPLTLGQSPAADLAQGELLRIWDVAVPGGVPVSVVGELHDPGPDTIQLAWFTPATAAAGRSGAAATAVSDGTGRVRLDLGVPPAGNYGLALFREPGSGGQKQLAGAAGAAKVLDPPLIINLSVVVTPPDHEPLFAPGWASPLVPRAAADGTTFDVPAPLTLPGGGATYLNLAAINSSTGGGATITAGVHLDGQAVATVQLPVNPGLGYAVLNSSPVVTVSGGRHVLSMLVDPAGAEAEVSETNNLRGEQWVWAPLTLVASSPVTRPAPAPLDGGWDEITTLDPIYFDCDGLRTPGTGSGGWSGSYVAVAVMPGPASDVDLNLHETSNGADSGFGDSLTGSSWSTGRSDYVLANFQATSPRAFDAGVVRWLGTEDYAVEAVGSTLLGSAGSYGPFTGTAGGILQLFELDLTPGFWNLRLESLAGAVDWGLTLHDAMAGFGSKIPLQTERIVDGGGPGAGEALTVQITAAGRYCLAVWKSTAADLAQTGQFRLVIDGGLTAVPGAPTPTALAALRSVHPNPFNPRTTVAIDLGRTGSVRVSVYDLRGELVRTLVDAVLAAGPHEIEWNGADDGGRRVASGVYTVRLQAFGEVDERKVSLVK